MTGHRTAGRGGLAGRQCQQRGAPPMAGSVHRPQQCRAVRTLSVVKKNSPGDSCRKRTPCSARGRAQQPENESGQQPLTQRSLRRVLALHARQAWLPPCPRPASPRIVSRARCKPPRAHLSCHRRLQEDDEVFGKHEAGQHGCRGRQRAHQHLRAAGARPNVSCCVGTRICSAFGRAPAAACRHHSGSSPPTRPAPASVSTHGPGRTRSRSSSRWSQMGISKSSGSSSAGGLSHACTLLDTAPSSAAGGRACAAAAGG